MFESLAAQVTRIAIRTLWFDQQLLAALDAARQPQLLRADVVVAGNDGSGGGGSISAGGVRLQLAANATPRQVVLLGAGMDTRAWRLALPAGEFVLHPALLLTPHHIL